MSCYVCLQVSSRNPVSLTEAATNHLSAAAAGQVATAVPLQPAVVLVAFTKDGLGLITVDVRPATGEGKLVVGFRG